MVDFKYLKSIEQGEKTLCVMMDGTETIFDKRIHKVVEDILLIFGTTIENSKMINEKLFNINRLAPIIASVEYGMYYFINAELNNRNRDEKDIYVINSYGITKVKTNSDGTTRIYYDDIYADVPMTKYHINSQLNRIDTIRQHFKMKMTKYNDYLMNQSKEN